MRISDWSSDVCSSDLSFSLRKGQPPYVEAYQQRADRGADRRSEDKVLLGYVFLSTDIVDIPGYSGQPIVTLIGMDTHGVITGTQVLRHAEPILLLGIPEDDLIHFIAQYTGRFVGAKVHFGGRREIGRASCRERVCQYV